MKSYLKKQRLLKLASISIVALSLITPPAAYAEEPCEDEAKVYQTDVAKPSANMLAAYPDKTFKGFGDTGINKFFGHTFTSLNIPGKKIVGATLEIKAKPGNSSLSNNDTLSLKFFGTGGSALASGWSAYFGSGNPNPGLLPQQWIIIFYQNGHTFNLDLGNLPNGGNIINDLNNHGFVDVLVQDDTTIESVKLTVKYECTCTPPPPDMVAWWPLDEVSGTNANDIINNNDGTYQNGPVPVSGKVAGALNFDGVNDYVKVPDNNVLDFGANQDFSIDAWIRTKKTHGIQTIVDKRYEDGKKNTKGYAFFLSNGKLSFQLATGNGSWFCGNSASNSCTNYGSSSANLADGKWHHVTVTVNRSSAPLGTFYVDGLPIGTTPISSFRLGDLSNAQPLTIGRNTNTIVGSNFQGNIDEVEIFNRVLTAKEVYALWFADKHGKCKKPDIWIADPLPDAGVEPNTVSANIWMSPDIWVRNQPDGLTQHQKVKFGQDNYVYVRARNIGNATATNTTIEVYRTQASTSNIWPTGWLLVGSANIPTLNPSSSNIVSIHWPSQDIPNPGHYCFYARAINVSDPLHIPEGTDAIANTFNNNNIAWRNFNVIDLSPTDPVRADFIVRPILNVKPLTLVFEATNEKGEVIKLADELTNVTIGGLEKLPIKDLKGLEMVEGKAKLTGDKGSFIIDVAKGEEVKLNLTFAPTALTQKDLSGKVYFHVKQFEGEELIGGVSYELRPPEGPLSVSLDSFTANAADGKITINWTTGTETDNAGFTLWRATPIDGQCSTDPYNYKDVKQVQPLVYSKSQDGVLGASYSEQDQNVEPKVTYCYGLEDIEYNGKRTFHVDNIISATLN